MGSAKHLCEVEGDNSIELTRSRNRSINYFLELLRMITFLLCNGNIRQKVKFVIKEPVEALANFLSV